MHETGKEHNTCTQWQQQTPWQADKPISFAPKRPVVKTIEERQQEAAELVAHKESTQEQPSDEHTVHALRSNDQVDPMIRESLGQLPNLCPQVKGDHSILKDIKNGYPKDLLLSKVLENVTHHKNFEITEDLIYTHNCAGDSVLCIPSIVQKKRRLTEVIIAQAHKVLGHFGPQKTVDYICCYYWWPHIGQKVELYCKTCPICQMMKSSTQRVPGLLHSLPVPTQPWRLIAMDFVGPFPESNGHNYLWEVICHLTSMIHLVPICTMTTASALVWLYV